MEVDMDEKIRDIFDKVKVTAAAAGEKVGKGVETTGKIAGDMVEITKLKMKIFDLKNDVNILYRELGQALYKSHAEPDADSPDLSGKLEAIDVKMEAIEKFRQRIAEFRAGQSGRYAKAGDGENVCPHCGERL
ncbi:hypothetical protein FACS1894171_0960 [Clostridia bacterium]|nr:hypothetical protein FACS1894171_0960 [Clostridia bacterium]